MKFTGGFGAVCLFAALLAGCGGGGGGGGASQGGNTLGLSGVGVGTYDAVVVTLGGAGTVTSSPPGINCVGPGSCSGSFQAGTTVTLNAVPSTGQSFVGWGGACAGTISDCVITVTATENVGANFAPSVATVPLQVTVGGAGTVVSNPTGINCSGAGGCTQWFDIGTPVTLTAVPASGNVFVGWTGPCTNTTASCTLTLNSAQSVGATFAPAVQSDSLQVSVGGSGTITSNPAGINCSGATGCSFTFANGTSVTLSATPGAGYSFAGWSGACSGSASSCAVTLTAATQTVGATFTPIVQLDSLQVTVGGSGGVTSNPTGINCGGGATSCTQSYANGTSVTLTAAPNSGFAFSGWSGSCAGTAPSCVVTLSAANQSVGASFVSTVQYFALQVASNGNGIVTSSPTGISCDGYSGCNQSFTSGTSVTLTATPASGYTFAGWSGACGGASLTCTLTMSAAMNVTATFAASAPPPPPSGQYISSGSYPATGPQPYKFLISAPNGPIPASQQPYEVWPVLDANNQPYFLLDVSATGPWGAWTSAQLQGISVVALDQTGWIVSN
jgi:hypothetical protein